MKKCLVENCNNIHMAKGYCNTHYIRFKKYGDINGKAPLRLQRKCSVIDCNSKYHSRGYCVKHYMKMIRKNNPPCILCNQPRVGKGYCQKHYQRLKTYGDPNKTIINVEHSKICSIEGCNNPFRADNMCNSHYMIEYNLKRRKIVINHYSNGTNKCSCCGESIFEFLTIDHINNDGSEHRKEIGGGGHTLIDWIIKNNYPQGFNISCFNCNSGRAYNNGICPHITG